MLVVVDHLYSVYETIHYSKTLMVRMNFEAGGVVEDPRVSLVCVVAGDATPVATGEVSPSASDTQGHEVPDGAEVRAAPPAETHGPAVAAATAAYDGTTSVGGAVAVGGGLSAALFPKVAEYHVVVDLTYYYYYSE